MRIAMAYRKKAASEKEKKRTVKGFLEGRLGLTDENMQERLEKQAELIVLKKGDTFIRTGENADRLYFLLEGAAMGWRENPEGRMQADCFLVRSGEPVISDGKIGQTSPVNFSMLTPGRLLAFPSEEIRMEMESSPELIRRYTEDLLECMRRCMGVRIICQRSARERYEWFLQEYGGSKYRIPDKYIASFLNMAPETLSRIKKEV